MTINNDRLLRSLAQLAGNPASETEAADAAARFADAQHRLETDPAEQARIAELTLALDNHNVERAEREVDLEAPPAALATAPRDEPTEPLPAARRHPSHEKPHAKRRTWFTAPPELLSALVAVVISVCAAVVTVLAASANAATFVATGMMVGVVLPKVIRSLILWRLTSKAISERATEQTAHRALELARLIDRPTDASGRPTARRRQHQLK